MGGFKGHFSWAWLLIFLVVMGCERYPAAVKDGGNQADSLQIIIENEIAQKKSQQAQIEEFQRRHLPRNFSVQIKKYFGVIRKYSKWYGLDWRLIIAMILKESLFKENARSNVGAMGLMQITPHTAREITRELDIAYISQEPRENITAGIYHLYKQLRYFPKADRLNRLKLALAAYNCGPARVLDAQDIARFKQLDPQTWEAVKACLPLLTSEHWKLHLEVWEQGAPNFGYFYGYEETIDYVDDIMRKYQLLKKMYKYDIQALALEDGDSNL